MCVVVLHLDGQAKVCHLGNAAALATAVGLQQHVADLQVTVQYLQAAGSSSSSSTLST